MPGASLGSQEAGSPSWEGVLGQRQVSLQEFTQLLLRAGGSQTDSRCRGSRGPESGGSKRRLAGGRAGEGGPEGQQVKQVLGTSGEWVFQAKAAASAEARSEEGSRDELRLPGAWSWVRG